MSKVDNSMALKSLSSWHDSLGSDYEAVSAAVCLVESLRDAGISVLEELDVEDGQVRLWLDADQWGGEGYLIDVGDGAYFCDAGDMNTSYKDMDLFLADLKDCMRRTNRFSELHPHIDNLRYAIAYAKHKEMTFAKFSQIIKEIWEGE